MDANTKDVALAVVGLLGSLGTGYIAYLATKRSSKAKLNGNTAILSGSNGSGNVAVSKSSSSSSNSDNKMS